MTKKKWMLSAAVIAVALVTALVLTTGTAQAKRKPPGPLCGFTAVWICTLPNGKQKEKVGTQCDIAKFEQRTGATCEIASGD